MTEAPTARERLATIEEGIKWLIQEARDAQKTRGELFGEQRGIRAAIAEQGAAIAANGVRIGQLESKHSSLATVVDTLAKKHHEQLGGEKLVTKWTGWITPVRAVIGFVIAAAASVAAWLHLPWPKVK